MSEQQQPPLPEFVGLIPKDKALEGWEVQTVRDTGEVITDVRHFRASSPAIGVLNWGLRQDGRIGWGWSERGGPVTIPIVFIEGQLYVGLLLEDHYNLGGSTLNAPRAMVKVGQTHRETALEDTLAEEMGYHLDEAEYVYRYARP